MKTATRYCTIILCSFIVTICSCNSLKWSTASNKSQEVVNTYHHYYNDSLQLYIQYFGSQILGLQKQQLHNYPDSVKRLLKGVKVKLGIKGEIAFVSRQTNRYFGLNYIALLNKPLPKNNFEEGYNKKISDAGAIFFEGQITCYKNYFVKPYIIPLNKANLYIITTKRNDASPDNQDSSYLQEHSFHEMMTLKTGSVYEPYKGVSVGMDSIMQILTKYSYLTALAKMQNLEPIFEKGQDSVYYKQMLLTSYSFIDEIDTVRRLKIPKAPEPPLIKTTNTLENTLDTRVQNAFSQVYKAAKNNEVLMINEAHYDWRHRNFAIQLLDSLYQLGYRHLAMETLSYDTSLASRGFPVIASGFYNREPYMGELMRHALRKGFSLVPYEDSITTDEPVFRSQAQKREYVQARNLANNIKAAPKGKWLVFAGYDHICKFHFGASGDSSMAMYFKKMTGIEPFCIDQARYCDLQTTPTAVQKLATGYYALSPGQIDDNILSRKFDMYIINNLQKQPYEETLDDSAYKQFEITLQSEKIEKNIGKCVVMIFYTNEIIKEKDCIPVYIKRITSAAQNRFTISLPNDKYTAIVKDEDGNIVEQKEIKETRR